MSTPPPGYLQTSSGLIFPESSIGPAPFGYGGARGNYTAATPDKAQNTVVFPELRATHDLPPQDRLRIQAMARWAERNTGIGNRIVTGIAEMVGSLSPNPVTSDTKWNTEAKALFNEFTGAAMIFDQAGEDSFETRQLTLTRKRLVDGDCLLALTKTSTDNPSTALFEAHQVGNPKGLNASTGWHDGVLRDARYRRLAYGILDESLRPTDVQLDAADSLYFGDPQTHAPRTASAFACFIKRLLDVRMMDNHQLEGIHAANLVGFYLKNSVLEATKARALADRRIATAVAGEAATTPEERRYNMEQVTGTSSTLAELGLGQSFETVQDTRRHPNTDQFVHYFIRDMAWGSGFPPEVLWFLGELTGPGVRFTIRQGERAAKKYRRNLIDRYCQRIWVWTIATFVKQGRLRPCTDSRWWRCDWLEPESMTIDLGRDITSGLDEIERGGNTFANWYGEVKQDWREQFAQKAEELKEAARLEKENGLPPGSLLQKLNNVITLSQGDLKKSA